jgi:uncharacterized protein
MFILIVLLIYSLMHYYLYTKLNAAFALNNLLQNVILVLMIFMVLSVILVQALSMKYLNIASLLAYPSYFWLAFLFLFTVSGFCVDIYNSVVHVGGWLFSPKINKLKFSPIYSCIIPIFLAVGICIYGFFAGRDVQTKSLTIKTTKLPATVTKLRIVQISDLHLGLMTSLKQLDKIIDLIKVARPDLLVSTGDLFDSNSVDMQKITDLLKAIPAPLGKYAVTGNHEFIFGINKSTELTEQAGFALLRQQIAAVDHKLTLVGVDDPMARQFGIVPHVAEIGLLQSISHRKKQFVLLLKHNPNVESASLALFDLQLSGHTHHGQIFPFIGVIRLIFPYETGVLHKIGSAYLYITNGTGTFGPPIRFLAPPEIVVIDLVPA